MPKVLKAKFAGLPRWAWIVVGAGAVGGYYWYYRQQGLPPVTDEETAEVADPSQIEAGAQALDGMNYNDTGGVPIGYYDSVSGALPNAQGAGTTEAFDINGFIAALAAGDDEPTEPTVGPRGKPGVRGKRGKPGKSKHGPKGGGGPPNRPRPKGKGKPKGGHGNTTKPKDHKPAKHPKRKRGKH